jgi:hypothetical protein
LLWDQRKWVVVERAIVVNPILIFDGLLKSRVSGPHERFFVYANHSQKMPH